MIEESNPATEAVPCDLCPFGEAAERFWQHSDNGDGACRLIAVCEDCVAAGAGPDFREDCEACQKEIHLH